MFFPDYTPETYICNKTQLFLILRRVDIPGKPEGFKLLLEDAYQYEMIEGTRVHATRWVAYSDLRDSCWKPVPLQRYELPARHRTPV